jgi:hypothetical protein
VNLPCRDAPLQDASVLLDPRCPAPLKQLQGEIDSPVDELALDAIRESLDRESIIDMASNLSRKHAGRTNYTPEQVVDVVHE